MLMPTKEQPSFFLASAEGYHPMLPRRCYARGRRLDPDFGPGLLVLVEPEFRTLEPLAPSQLETHLLVVPRERGLDLLVSGAAMIPVHIMVPLNDAILRGEIEAADRSHYMWGEVYKTMEEALRSLEQAYGKDMSTPF